MPTASAVASELRKLADALDKEPEAEIVRPNVYLSCRYEGTKSKPIFLALARILPRPLKKETTEREYSLTYENTDIRVHSYVDRSDVCILVEPAKPAVYRCEPLLSDEEEAALTENSNA